MLNGLEDVSRHVKHRLFEAHNIGLGLVKVEIKIAVKK
jgi:hypothetical protein